MAEPDSVVIPNKIYFKIGEVCELVGVQAHVLRYWETEFSMLSPQKNQSGQRSYRRRDVEVALAIKRLLYNEMFTIAGARKKLQADQRDGARAQTAPVRAPERRKDTIEAPTLFDTGLPADSPVQEAVRVRPSYRSDNGFSPAQQAALKKVASGLIEIREMLKSSAVS
jgi:DNA-binding transcriptional MerR regulator